MAKEVSELYDRQAEASAVATVIAHPEFITNFDNLKPGYFFDVANGCLYWAIETLVSEGVENINVLNLSNIINSNKGVKRTLEHVGIAQKLPEFIAMSSVAACGTREEYRLIVNRVVSLAFRRELFKATQTIQNGVLDDNMDLSKLNKLVNTSIDAVTERFIVAEKMVPFTSQIDEMWDRLVASRNEDGSIGIPTKLPTLNTFFTYLPGELTLIGGIAKAGKSSFFLNEAIHKARLGVPVFYYDTEISNDLFFRRALANISGVDIKRIESGLYGSDEQRQINKAMDLMKELPLEHQYVSEIIDLDQVYAYHKILQNSGRLGFSVFDYIKSNALVTGENYNLLGAIADFLKNRICGEMKIPMLAGTQLSRSGTEIADSFKPIMYCSNFSIWREKTLDERVKDGVDFGNYALKVMFNRNGPKHDEDEYLSINFDKDRMRIEEAKQPTPVNTPFDGR